MTELSQAAYRVADVVEEMIEDASSPDETSALRRILDEIKTLAAGSPEEPPSPFSFSVDLQEHGALVFWESEHGAPVAIWAAVARLLSGLGWDLLVTGDAGGAKMTVTNEEHRDAFRAGQQAAAKRAAGDDEEMAWLLGPDTGISSLTIFSVLASTPALRQGAKGRLRNFGSDTPKDPADFWRCRQLLARFPGWRERLGEVAAAHPRSAWGRLGAAWEEMEALYAEEEPTGKCPKLYARMQELLGRDR